jgi:hypothetical protein
MIILLMRESLQNKMPIVPHIKLQTVMIQRAILGNVAKQDADNAAYQAADRDDSESDSDQATKRLE